MIRRIFPIRIRNRRLQVIRYRIRVLTQIHPRLHLHHLRMNWRMIPSLIKQCIFLAIIGHVLTYMPYVVHRIAPKWAYEPADMFLSPWYHYKMARYFYFKETSMNTLLIIYNLIVVKICAKFSDILFVVFFIFLGYSVIDFCLYWWNWNTNFDLYVDLLWTILVLVNAAIFPYPTETVAKIKSLF